MHLKYGQIMYLTFNIWIKNYKRFWKVDIRSEERRVGKEGRDTRWPRDWSSDVCSSDLSVIVSDIVYQPLYTSFLQTAQSLGARIHFGHTMLLYQAQYAFEIWTNHVPNVQHMDKELQKILEG